MDYKKIIKSIALVVIIVFQILFTFFPSKETGILFAVLIFGIFLWFNYMALPALWWEATEYARINT